MQGRRRRVEKQVEKRIIVETNSYHLMIDHRSAPPATGGWTPVARE